MSYVEQTLEKFGGSENIIKEYSHWYLLLRPIQITLGSLVLICKDNVTNFHEISPQSFEEKKQVIQDLETCLSEQFQYDKINYLMLMMVDPAVHYHIIPRYSDAREFEGSSFKDYSWPGPPDVFKSNEISESQFSSLKELLRLKTK